MREILFRGKAIKSNKWVFGDYVSDAVGISHQEYLNEYGDIGDVLTYVIPETVGQYTGLTDMNGKRIFEGDIFKFPDEIFESYYTSCGTEYNSWAVENYGVVGFCEDTGRFDFVEYKFNENSVEAELHENHDIEFYEFVSDLEVIGNIYDNPELLRPSLKPEYRDGDPDYPICPNCRTPLNEIEDCDCGAKIDWSEEE